MKADHVFYLLCEKSAYEIKGREEFACEVPLLIGRQFPTFSVSENLGNSKLN